MLHIQCAGRKTYQCKCIEITCVRHVVSLQRCLLLSAAVTWIWQIRFICTLPHNWSIFHSQALKSPKFRDSMVHVSFKYSSTDLTILFVFIHVILQCIKIIWSLTFVPLKSSRHNWLYLLYKYAKDVISMARA